MIKSKIVLEVVKSERLYQFICLPESPLGEIYDVMNEMRALVIQKIMDEQKSRESKDQDEQKESEA